MNNKFILFSDLEVVIPILKELKHEKTILEIDTDHFYNYIDSKIRLLLGYKLIKQVRTINPYSYIITNKGKKILKKYKKYKDIERKAEENKKLIKEEILKILT